ncbi:MAG: V-type ATPase subunit [Coriobacteriia bacterium]|nr:V-type ATPase subunit [Coriobacteriia bacterium]
MGVIVDEYRATRDGMRFGFAVGKVMILQTRLLDGSAFERLIDAPSFAEQKRILSDTPYGSFLDGATTPTEVENALEDARDSAYRFLDEAGLPPAVVRFFRARFDFANLKAALKARSLGVGLEDLLVGHGTVPIEAFAGPLEKLPEPLGSTAARLSAAESTDGGQAGLLGMDAAVDRVMFSKLGDDAREAKSPFLRGIAALFVDMANLKIFVRARAAGLSVARVSEELLIPGGTVAIKELARAYRLGDAEAYPRLESRLRLEGRPLSGEAGVGDLDILVDDALVAAVRRERRPEPGADDVIAYVLAREAEAQVLRVALLGKMSGLDSTALHRRIRASLR